MVGFVTRPLRLIGLVGVLVASAVATTAGAPTAAADGPGVGSPWVVSLGDSAISGEAGRWAGNTNVSPTNVDASGSDAYFDNAANTGEQIPGCHRSESAAIHIGTVNSHNLACSGAKTSTQGGGSSDFKPGLDFSNTSSGKGQALALQEFASTHNVKMVSVLIGANDYGFADLLQTCFLNWYLSPSWWPNYCYDDSDVAARFTTSNIAAKTTAIKTGLLNVRQAMSNAGYADSSYTIMVDTYWSPIPKGAANRYPQGGGYTRQTVGGCGMWNKDADWANNTVVPTFNNSIRNAITQSGLTNTKILDFQTALNGRRLCENTVGLLEEKGLASWTSVGAVDKTEWVNQLRTTSTLFGPYQVQESVHANYWGQLAMRACMRLAYNGGVPVAGKCVRTATGLNAYGEPKMGLL